MLYTRESEWLWSPMSEADYEMPPHLGPDHQGEYGVLRTRDRVVDVFRGLRPLQTKQHPQAWVYQDGGDWWVKIEGDGPGSGRYTYFDTPEKAREYARNWGVRRFRVLLPHKRPRRFR